MKEVEGELQIEQDMDFQQKNWKFERFGWAVLLLIFIAALAGFFGRGGFIWNKNTAGNTNSGLEVTYSKFLRRQTPSEMQLIAAGATATIQFQNQKIDKLKIDKVIPEPEKIEYNSDKVTLTFKPGGAETREIKIYFNPQKSGTFHTKISTGTGSSVTINQFIYP